MPGVRIALDTPGPCRSPSVQRSTNPGAPQFADTAQSVCRITGRHKIALVSTKKPAVAKLMATLTEHERITGEPGAEDTAAEEMSYRAGCDLTRDRMVARLKATDDELLSRKAKGDCPQEPCPTWPLCNLRRGQSFLPVASCSSRDPSRRGRALRCLADPMGCSR